MRPPPQETKVSLWTGTEEEQLSWFTSILIIELKPLGNLIVQNLALLGSLLFELQSCSKQNRMKGT